MRSECRRLSKFHCVRLGMVQYRGQVMETFGLTWISLACMLNGP
jgi:hypothetical protein